MNSSNTTGHRVSSGVRMIHSRECVALEWPGLAESQVLCPWQRWLIRVVVNHYDPLWGTLYSVIFCRYYDYKCKYINNYRHIHTHMHEPKKKTFIWWDSSPWNCPTRKHFQLLFTNRPLPVGIPAMKPHQKHPKTPCVALEPILLGKTLGNPWSQEGSERWICMKIPEEKANG